MSDFKKEVNQSNTQGPRITRTAVRQNPELIKNIIIPNNQTPFTRSRKVIRSPPANSGSPKDSEQVLLSDINNKKLEDNQQIATPDINQQSKQNLEIQEILKENKDLKQEDTTPGRTTGTVKKQINQLNKNHLSLKIPLTPAKREEFETVEKLDYSIVSPTTPATAIPIDLDRTGNNTKFLQQETSLIDIEGISDQPSLIGNPSNLKFNFTLDFENLLDGSRANDINMAENPLRLSLKYVANLVPEFDGKNISVNEYIEKLKHAKNMLSQADQANLIPILKIKLKGETYKAMLNVTINTIEDFIKAIRQIYPSTENMHSLYGQIEEILQKQDESVLSFANRVQELVLKIKDTEEVQGFSATEKAAFQTKINADAFQGFKEGLKQEIRIELGAVTNLEEAIKKAIATESKFNKRGILCSKINNIYSNSESILDAFEEGAEKKSE